jgi:uncharacterized protein YceK
MRNQVATCLAIAVVVAVGGCGTSLNLDGDSRVFGGVQMDAQKLQESLAHASANPRPDGKDKSSPGMNLLEGACALADMPLSLIGDTLTLPITIPTTIEEQYDQDPNVQQVDVRPVKAPSSNPAGNPPSVAPSH